MLAFSGFAFGAFQQFSYAATAFWVCALFISGLILRRYIVRSLLESSLTFLASFLVFTITLFIISLSFGGASQDFVALRGTVFPMIGSVYLPFFWLPLAIGLVAVQFRLPKRHHET